jgi:hypothetical protein
MAIQGQVLNVLGWHLDGRDARTQLPARSFQPHPAFPVPGPATSPTPLAPTPVVSRADYAATGFSAAHLGDAVLHGLRSPSGLAVEVTRLLEVGEPFVYAYYDGIDKVAHGTGLGAHYDAELRAVDRLVADVASELPAGAVLVVTADHGQIDVGSRVELLGREIMSSVRLLSGEGRFRWLHAHPGAAEDLEQALTERYRDSTWVLGRQQAIDEGLFGGPIADDIVDRLGDVVLIPHTSIAFLDPADTGESRLRCRHGSLTGDEMLVPLVALAGPGNI